MKHLFFALLMLSVSVTHAQTEPTNQPTDLTFSNIKAYNFNLSFQPSQADGYLVLKSTQPVTFEPQDGVVYETGQGTGNAKVLSTNSTTSFLVREVVENTEYHFAIFAYNRSGNNINYKQTNPLIASTNSAQANFGNYYNGLNANATEFVTRLTQKINNRNVVAYTSYATLIVPAIFERDTTAGNKVVTCEYSGEQKVYSPPFAFQTIGYSREHLLPRSWMPTGGATNTAEGSDYHNLALTNLNNVNSLRSNYALGNVVTPTTTFLNCRLGKDTRNITVFEPTASKKGDAARGIFYQIVCYNGTGGSNWGFFNLPSLANEQVLQTLVDWHFADLPDAAEKAKHEYIYTIQNNRNPFIDYPELVNCIDFNQILKQATCNSTVSVEDVLGNENIFILQPNPTNNVLQIITTVRDVESISLFDLTGRLVNNEKLSIQFHHDNIMLNVASLNAGTYFVQLTFKNGAAAVKKLMVQ